MVVPVSFGLREDVLIALTALTRRPGLASRQAWIVSRLMPVSLYVELHQRLFIEERRAKSLVRDLGPGNPQRSRVPEAP